MRALPLFMHIVPHLSKAADNVPRLSKIRSCAAAAAVCCREEATGTSGIGGLRTVAGLIWIPQRKITNILQRQGRVQVFSPVVVLTSARQTKMQARLSTRVVEDGAEGHN